MPKPQLQQAAAMVILSDMTIILARQCGTKQTASKLATSGSSSAAVGETVARRPRSSPRARTALTSDASDASKRHRRRAKLMSLLSLSYLISYLYVLLSYLSPPLSGPPTITHPK
jgi:hypothetical protein